MDISADFKNCLDRVPRNGAGGRVGFEINASRAGTLMRTVLSNERALMLTLRFFTAAKAPLTCACVFADSRQKSNPLSPSELAEFASELEMRAISISKSLRVVLREAIKAQKRFPMNRFKYAANLLPDGKLEPPQACAALYAVCKMLDALYTSSQISYRASSVETLRDEIRMQVAVHSLHYASQIAQMSGLLDKQISSLSLS